MQPRADPGLRGGAILAGGAGRRMGGVLKAGLPLGGETLLARATRRLAPQVGPLAICAGPAPERLAGLIPPGAACLPDRVAGFAGPLAGLSAALDWAAAQGLEDLLTVAVDTPFFPRDLGDRLAAGRGAALAALAEDDDGPHPTCGLWRVALAPELRAALDAGTRRMTDLATRATAVTVRFPGGDAFFNINRAEDLVQAKARL